MSCDFFRGYPRCVPICLPKCRCCPCPPCDRCRGGSGYEKKECPVPNAPRITFPTEGAVIEGRFVTVNGTAEPNGKIEVCIDGNCGNVTADRSGSWSYPSQNLSPNAHTVTAAAKNWCGSISESVPVGFATTDFASEQLFVTNLTMGSVYRTVDAVFDTRNRYDGLTVYYVLLNPSFSAPAADEIISYDNVSALTDGNAARGSFYVPPEGFRASVMKSLRGREVASPYPDETGVVDGFPYTVYAAGVLDSGNRTNVATYAGSAIGMPFESGTGSAEDPFVLRDYSVSELDEYPDQLQNHPLNRAGANETARQLDNIQGMAELRKSDAAKGLSGTLADAYVLNTDFDLASYRTAYQNQGWRPVGTVERDSEYRFTGTFDGAEHTVSNLFLTPNGAVQPVGYSGLFGYAENAVIRNLGLRGVLSAPVPISGQISAGALAGYLYNPSLASVTVEAASFRFQFPESGSTNVFAGGIAGHLSGGTAESLTVSDVSFLDENGATDDSGGVFGYVSNEASAAELSNLNASNIRVTGYGGEQGLVFGGVAGLVYLINGDHALTMNGISSDGTEASVDNMDAGGVVGRIFQYAEANISDWTVSNASLASATSGFYFVGGAIGDVYCYARFNVDGISVNASETIARSGSGGVFGQIRVYENGYADVSNLTAQAEVRAILSYAGGLIGALSRTGSSYVRITASNVLSGSRIDSPNQAGGLVGDLFHTTPNSYVYIDNCNSAAEVDGDSVGRYAGGLVGFGNYVAMNACSASGTVRGSREEFSVGGLFGEASGVYLLNCRYNGNIYGYTFVGGLIGTAHGLPIRAAAYPSPFETKDNVVELCSAEGTLSVVSEGQAIGGLAGEATDILFDRCFAKMPIAAANSANVGGLIGVRNLNIYNANIAAQDSYYSGSVTDGSNNVGGGAGLGDETILRVFAAGTVSGAAYVAGICGNQPDPSKSTENCFALQTSVTASGAPSSRVANSDGTLQNNFALSTMLLTEYGAARTAVSNASERDGGDVAAANLEAAMRSAGFSDTVWDFSTLASLGYPTLNGNPE